MVKLSADEWRSLYCTEQNPKTDFFLDRSEDDSCGKGAVFRELWSLPSEQRPGGILFTGPEGSGRHNTAANLAGWLADRHKYDVIFLSGAELCCGAEEFSDVKERFDAVLDDCYDNGFRPLCIILERPEECSWGEQLSDFLGKILFEYKQMENHPDEEMRYPALFMIFLPEQKWNVPAFLRRQLRICSFSLPDRDQRLAFSVNHGADELGDFIAIDTLADITEGMNYFQLADVIENARLTAMSIENGKTSSDILSVETLIRSQLPDIPEKDKREKLEKKLGTFLEELPKALMRIRIGGAVQTAAVSAPAAVMPAVSAQSDAAENAVPGTTSIEDLEKMRVAELISTAFDKDIADSLLSKESMLMLN